MIGIPILNIPMSATDLTVLNQILTDAKAERDPSSSEAEYWEYFSAEQILRDYDFDPDEIKSGIVGQSSNAEAAGTDGGIDSMYLIVNGKLIRDEEQARALKEHKGSITFDIIIIQSKKVTGFNIATLLRLGNTSESIFQIQKQPSDFSEKYNQPLLAVINLFRETHRALLLKSPKISVHFYYATAADTNNIHDDVRGKSDELERKIPAILSTIRTCKVFFFGARETITLFQKPRKSAFSLKCLQSMTDGKGGYVALVELSEYYNLIVHDGRLREYLFEANVRDYEGDVDVNQQIKTTLQNVQEKPNFWWLNNGITIVASKIEGHPAELVLHDPQVVNGLQTSQVIFQCLNPSSQTAGADKRHVVIRIIESPDEVLQDQVIRATNSQTKIPNQFLWASDDKQRDIELLFKSRGLHYDRRKNSWRKSSLSFDRIVSMTELAQAVAAINLQEPDHARARPSRYFKHKEHYSKLFRHSIPIEIYVVCALLRKRAEAFLKKVENNSEDRNNLLFYVLMAVRPILLRKRIKGKGVKLHEIDVTSVADDSFRDALAIVRPIYEKHGASDKAAKGVDLLADLRVELAARFSRKAKKPKGHITLQ